MRPFLSVGQLSDQALVDSGVKVATAMDDRHRLAHQRAEDMQIRAIVVRQRADAAVARALAAERRADAAFARALRQLVELDERLAKLIGPPKRPSD